MGQAAKKLSHPSAAQDVAKMAARLVGDMKGDPNTRDPTPGT
jgi:hypothetical protein